MTAFLLETLAGRTWRRDGRLFWTRTNAEREARRILRRGKAVEVRILPTEVSHEPIDTLAASEEGER